MSASYTTAAALRRLRRARERDLDRARSLIMASALLTSARRHAAGETDGMPTLDDESWRRILRVAEWLAETAHKLERRVHQRRRPSSYPHAVQP